MAAVPSPTVRRKRLGTELRRLREQACLTCEGVGQRLDCSGTRISRIETGRISVRPGDVRELLEVYGVTGDRADALVELAREARRKGWWHRFGPVMPSWLEPYLGLEAEAARLRDFQSMVLPGLVQTEDYTRAILRAAPDAGPACDIEQQVALRMERQAVLDWLRQARHQAADSYLPDSGTVKESCLDDVAASDLYVLILGHRYGFRPPLDNSEGLSITHLEWSTVCWPPTGPSGC